jgi:putative transposase
MNRSETLYKGHRIAPDIIQYAVWVYYRFTMIHRDVEDLLAERGVTASYETIRLWCKKFGPSYANSVDNLSR